MKKTSFKPSTEPLGEEPLSEERTGPQHFQGLSRQRKEREWWRDAFLSKAARTSRSHRRWFRLDEIESDAEKRQELLGLWRASIYSRDLDLKGRSQVLCLTASPLLEGYRSPRARSDLFRDDKTISARTKAVLAAAKRLPAELARAEHFNASVGDLWMSAPRWRESLTGKDTKPP